MEAKSIMPFFFFGFVLAAFLNINLVGFGILGVVFAIFYIQLNPTFNKSQVVADDFDEL
ncbi:Mannose permease IIC component [compost metagenome]